MGEAIGDAGAGEEAWRPSGDDRGQAHSDAIICSRQRGLVGAAPSQPRTPPQTPTNGAPMLLLRSRSAAPPAPLMERPLRVREAAA